MDHPRDILDTVAMQEDLLTGFAAGPTLDRLVAGINQSVGGFRPLMARAFESPCASRPR
jgi:hypothetical protein